MKKFTLFMVMWMIVMVSATPLWAALQVRDYEKLKGEEVIEIYINGVGVGYSWANTELDSRQQPPLYCQPNKLSLNANNYIKILDKEMLDSKRAITPETFIELILLEGLKKTFPCGQK